MIPYVAQNQFTPTNIYDLSDLVKGGIDGTSNIPLMALLDRTIYLQDRLARYEGLSIQTGSYSYNAADIRKFFVFDITSAAVFSLPDVTTLAAGSIIPIRTRISVIKALTVQCYGAQMIKGGGLFGNDVSAMYMHTCETLVLVAAEDHWEVLVAYGNFYQGIGETHSGRIQGLNMIVGQGQLVNRADLPRITEYLSFLTPNQQVVSDAVWLSDPSANPVYRGCYSYGNGTTTLRLPDERGLFERFLDLGRGIDNNRLHNYPGGYEIDQFKEHDHSRNPTSSPELNTIWPSPGGGGDLNGGGRFPVNLSRTGKAGSDQTHPKNIGKIPLIRY